MTELSRVRLNPTRRDTHRLLASPQAMHAAVMGSHPQLADEDSAGRVLWRVDQAKTHDIQLYVVSPSAPDFTGLIEQAGWPSQPQWDSTAYEPFLDRLAAGQAWRFRLTANPVRVLPKQPGGPRRGRVSPHLTADQQREWLVKHARSWGFEVATDETFGVLSEVSERHTVSFGRREAEAGRSRVSLSRASFAGLLTVVAPSALRTALVGGMGRAKAYGCGLMTLAPPRS
ncbi:type I-E CRISPR-associated protein Cas6/Cse3/CasE [Nostocoides vanveenii]|uniref:Type I-E CRISPR-associated protein Cas6/Cse3/CasE n=1 Tax=Nostocoides vanveenii TaxID=330835 RepID=A0ABN2KC81_9MICO